MEPKATQYETIWNAEDADREEFLSETDVESGHEKQWHSDEVNTRKWEESRGMLSKIKAYSWIINTSLLLFIIGLLTLLLLREPQRQQIGSDFSGSHRQCEHICCLSALHIPA